MDPADIQKHLRAGAGQAVNNRGALTRLVIGIGILLISFIIHMLSIEATEAWILGNKVTSYIPDWTLLLQIPGLFYIPHTPIEVESILAGWGVEFVWLSFVFYYNHSLAAVGAANFRLKTWFEVGMVVIVVINIITTYFYTPAPAGPAAQVGSTIVIVFLGAFGILMGGNMVEHGFADWKTNKVRGIQ